MMSGFRTRQLAVLGPLFVLLLLFFMRGGWYEQAELVIRGTAADTREVIDVSWDSGEGLNDYERRRFSFLPFKGSEDRNIDIAITRERGAGGAQTGGKVRLIELRIDDRGQSISDSAQNDIRRIKGHGWGLHSEQSAIRLTHPASQRISFIFSTSLSAGEAAISIDKQQFSHDLSRDNWEVLMAQIDYWLLDESGNFTVSFKLPRYRIDTLLISGSTSAAFSSVHLKQRGVETDLPFSQREDGSISLTQPMRSLKRYFQPFHFAVQVGAALLLTWLVQLLAAAAQRCGGMRQALIGPRYRPFWLFFCGTLTMHGLWLVAFWPGVMSVDSLNIWRAAVLPDVRLANHPYVNELWYLFLSLFWTDPAIVPMVHVVLISTLTAAAFSIAYRWGVPLLALITCWLLLLISVPVGLYNVTLWKDVPFALLVVFWGLVPVYAFFRKRAGRKLGVSFPVGVLLLISFAALLTVRYNGFVYLFVIPLLAGLIYSGRFSKRFLAVLLVVGAGICYLVLFPPAAIDKNSYFNDFSRIYLNRIKAESVSARVMEAAADYPRILDIKKHEKISDFWHYYLGDRYAYDFLLDVGWYDVYPYQSPDNEPAPKLHQTALNIYRASLEYPWLYLSWYPFVLLYLFPLSLLLCRWFPLSAIFSTVILTQVAGLLFFVGTTNWRYYYFVLLGGYFLLPIILLDLRFLRLQKAVN